MPPLLELLFSSLSHHRHYGQESIFLILAHSIHESPLQDACAIGRQACAFGYKTIYFSMSKFLEKIALCKLEGTLLKFLNQMEKMQLLILDDFRLHPLDANARLALLQIRKTFYNYHFATTRC